MSELSQLIEIAKNIEKQNAEIIRLLKKIADEEDKPQQNPVIDLGELYLSNDETFEVEERGEVENTLQIGSLLDTSIDVGEVYFIEDGDIFCLSVKDGETLIDNLTSAAQADEFSLQESIACKSVENSAALDGGTVILSSCQCENLPETLRICVEQGAKKVYLPLFASAQLVGAPQSLMDILKFDFYKNNENLIEKLFG